MPDPSGPASPVATILQHLRTPPRTWSVVMTVFGDAVLPRSGSLGVQPLLDILAGMAIGSGAVRTALSRLASDGWLQATRVGRKSSYQLTQSGQTATVAASKRIYGPPTAWDGHITLLLPGGNTSPPDRDALGAAGFAPLTPTIWIAPSAAPAPPGTLLRLEATPDPETARRLAEQAWPLQPTAEAYTRFLQAFTPLHQWTAQAKPLTDLEAMVGRILLVHEYRRVALRDPHLPTGLLPPDWPGTRARTLCSQTYPALLPASERWLDTQGPTSPSPPPSAELNRRFQSRDHVTDFP